MGYDIVLCNVLSVDLTKSSITLEPLNSQFLKSITVSAATGLKFASTYAPYYTNKDPVSESINNVPIGFVNFPEPGDKVLALIWMTDYSKEGTLIPNVAQNTDVEVIVLTRVQWRHPNLGAYDNIMLDRSGAKIHFNHGWLDPANLVESLDTYDKPHQVRTGHLTMVGNRFVQLSGTKFLPFGLFSHLLGQGSQEHPTNPMVLPDSVTKEAPGGSGKGKKWDEVFTQDPTEDIFDDLMDNTGIGSKKFLQPPCPEPGSDMHMHHSGVKELIEEDGHVRKYYPEGVYVIHGDNTAEDKKKMAFDPITHAEPTKSGKGVVEIRYLNGSNEIIIKIDPENDQIELTATKVKITGDLEVTGKGDFGTA